MDIFLLRNKLKSSTAKTAQSANGQTPVAAAYAAQPTVLEPLTLECETQPVVAVNLPERIGLDNIFDMTNSELNALSPNHTFTKLRVMHKGEIIEQVEHAPVPVLVDAEAKTGGLGLDAFLTKNTGELIRLMKHS